MKAYVEKPQPPKVREAVQVTADNLAEVAAWTGGVVEGDRVVGIPYSSALIGPLAVGIGLWVIQRDDGFFFIRDDDWFRANYEV